MKVVIAAGGTGGHIVPALALAEALGHEVQFLGASVGLENDLVPKAGYRLDRVNVRGFDRSKPLSIVPTGARAVAAILQARKLLRSVDADVVVGMGGYITVPACLGARSLGVPVVLHEQNAVLGLANRVARRVARRVCVAWEEALAQAGSKGALVGIPVARELTGLDKAALRPEALAHFGLSAEKKTLLVFGGSQGAATINTAAAGLGRAWRTEGDVQILHISGRVRDGTGDSSDDNYVTVPYVDRMALAYAVADLALCRGGAMTVAELGVVGLPAIIVPYPYHRDRQQYLHAEALERAGGAIVLEDSMTTPDRVSGLGLPLLRDEAKLNSMTELIAATGRPDAAAHMARIIEEVADE